jgi:hypothetical protein
MSSATPQASKDWLGNARAHALAWWLPQAAIVAALFAPVAIRSAVWIVALIWMGTACLVNARRCGRTHCRYTGPYYLAMIVPVLVLAAVAADFNAWIALAVLMLAVSKIIWWATERAWGKFS